MTREIANYDIASTLGRRGVPSHAIYLSDAYLALPTANWVQNAFARQLESVLRQLNFTYRTEQRDCENFAQWAAAMANYFHSETPNTPECGLAFGELWIGSREHAVNWAIHQDEKLALYVQAYEPQPNERGWTMEVLPLTEADWKSVWLCKA